MSQPPRPPALSVKNPTHPGGPPTSGTTPTQARRVTPRESDSQDRPARRRAHCPPLVLVLQAGSTGQDRHRGRPSVQHGVNPGIGGGSTPLRSSRPPAPPTAGVQGPVLLGRPPRGSGPCPPGHESWPSPQPAGDEPGRVITKPASPVLQRRSARPGRFYRTATARERGGRGGGRSGDWFVLAQIKRVQLTGRAQTGGEPARPGALSGWDPWGRRQQRRESRSVASSPPASWNRSLLRPVSGIGRRSQPNPTQRGWWKWIGWHGCS